jgi:exonuclease SbcD
MATDTYLKAEERKRLYAAHDGIVMLIPEAQHPDADGENHRTTIDLTQNMEALFKAYFRNAKARNPVTPSCTCLKKSCRKRRTPYDIPFH